VSSRAVGGAIGADAGFVAGGPLIAVGGYMLWPRGESDEGARAALLARTRGLAVIGLGVGISLDELPIGFSVGLLRFPSSPPPL